MAAMLCATGLETSPLPVSFLAGSNTAWAGNPRSGRRVERGAGGRTGPKKEEGSGRCGTPGGGGGGLAMSPAEVAKTSPTVAGKKGCFPKGLPPPTAPATTGREGGWVLTGKPETGNGTAGGGTGAGFPDSAGGTSGRETAAVATPGKGRGGNGTGISGAEGNGAGGVMAGRGGTDSGGGFIATALGGAGEWE